MALVAPFVLAPSVAAAVICLTILYVRVERPSIYMRVLLPCVRPVPQPNTCVSCQDRAGSLGGFG